MAITFDNSASGSSSGTTTTVALTIANQANRILIVSAVDFGGDTITGVTYNGVSMTQINKQVLSSGDAIYLFYLAAPATGNNDIVASRSVATSTFKVAGASYYGAAQTGIPDASNTNSSASTTSITTSVTTVADNSWTISSSASSRILSPSTGVTQRENQTDLAFGDSNGAITPPGSDSHTWTLSSTGEVGVVMASIAPSVDETKKVAMFLAQD